MKILACHYALPEHVGQVGTVASVRPGRISVFVSAGLCRAAEVGPPSSEDLADGDDEEPVGAARQPTD